MSAWIYVVNTGSVGLFGAVLSASFCDIRWSRGRKLAFLAAITVIGVFQALLYTALGMSGVRAWYPVITHLPLMFLLAHFTHKRIWSVIAVLAAYLCCQLRRWLALLCVGLWSGGDLMQNAVELAVTLPLLCLILLFAAPAVRGMSHRPLSTQVQFGAIPAIGYLFDYVTRVYTNWLVEGVPAAVEFMPFVCSAAYLSFVLYSDRIMRRQSEMEQTQTVLDLQVRQAVRQIDGLKKSQELAAQYRHDLRHHLQYLSACMENNDLTQAQAYIRDLNDEITRQTVTVYCENTAANLILSSFAGRAAETGVPMSVQLRLGRVPRISDSDLCVLLSNALENALHACVGQKAAGGEAVIEVRGYERDGRVFLEIVNSCGEEPAFRDGLPVTRQRGHGIGVRSICTIVEKYGGLYTFDAENGRFTLRLSL